MSDGPTERLNGTAIEPAAVPLAKVVKVEGVRSCTVDLEGGSATIDAVPAAMPTVRTAIAPQARAADLASPGHVFPLRAADGGVRVRRGHTEASVDLAELAGFKPAAVLCELANPDGSMARLPEITEFARKHDMPVVAIEDMIQWMDRRGAQAKA